MRLGEGTRLSIGTAGDKGLYHLERGSFDHEDQAGNGLVTLAERLPTMMNGHIRMLGEIVNVGRKCILQLEPFLSHFFLMSRENYEMHMTLSFCEMIVVLDSIEG